VIQRAELFARIAKKRDVSSLSRVFNDALEGTDEDELEALAVLFNHFIELNVVFLSRQRLFELARLGCDGEDSIKLAQRLNE